VGNGAKQEVYQAVLALCRPGDEVIIPAPYWPSYPEIVKLAGAIPVILETKASDGFLVDPEALSQAITPKTRMVRCCLKEREGRQAGEAPFLYSSHKNKTHTHLHFFTCSTPKPNHSSFFATPATPRVRCTTLLWWTPWAPS